MADLVLTYSSTDDAEQAIVEIWLYTERFGFSSPRLDFAFHRGYLILTVAFANTSIAMRVAQKMQRMHQGRCAKRVLPEWPAGVASLEASPNRA